MPIVLKLKKVDLAATTPKIREHSVCRCCNEVCQIEKIELELEHELQDYPLYFNFKVKFQTPAEHIKCLKPGYY